MFSDWHSISEFFIFPFLKHKRIFRIIRLLFSRKWNEILEETSSTLSNFYPHTFWRYLLIKSLHTIFCNRLYLKFTYFIVYSFLKYWFRIVNIINKELHDFNMYRGTENFILHSQEIYSSKSRRLLWHLMGGWLRETEPVY